MVSNKWIYLCLAIFLTAFWSAVIGFGWHYAKPVKVNCSLASFHPDISKKQKEECRK